MIASYRDISFYVKEQSKAGGKRGKIWNFPFENTPYNQEIGHKPSTIAIDGYLIGGDIQQRERDLTEAFEASNAGILIHPVYGEFSATVYSYSFKFTSSESKIIHFSAEFSIEKRLKIALKIDLKTSIDNRDKNIREKAKQDFIKKFNVLKKPVSDIQKAAQAVENTHKMLDEGMQKASQIEDFQKELMTLKGKGIELIYDPFKLATKIKNLLNFPSDFFEGLRLSETIEKSIDFSIESSENQIQMLNYFNVLTNIGSGIMSNATTNKNELLDKNTIINDKIDNILAYVDDNKLYDELLNYKNEIVQYLNEKILQLPEIFHFILPKYESAYNIIFEFQHEFTEESVTKFTDRNQILHPAFVPALIRMDIVNG
jgi:prophage DNA circulation protein